MTKAILKITGGAFLLMLISTASVIASDRLDVRGVEEDRLYTADGDFYALAGVRLVERAGNALLYKAMQDFLQSIVHHQDIRFDALSFQDKPMAENRYGDRIGIILRDNQRWLQEELVLRGYGVWNGMAGFPDHLRNRLLEAERAAIVERAGLWRSGTVLDANNPPKQYWKGEFVIARGVVRDVHRAPARTYLNFGDDWKTDFTAAIPSSARRNFEAGDWKLSELRNKSILIRGLVRFYNGPYLELDFPEQMEIERAADEEERETQ